MANLKFFVPLDPKDLTFGQFAGAEIGDHNKKSFELTTDNGATIDIEGHGFTYGKSHGELVVKTGDIESIEVKLGGDLPAFSLEGVDVPIEKLFKVALTKTLEDDYRLIQQMLSGKDHLDGSNGDDHLSGFGDSDVLTGGAGNDVLDGGKGNDVFVFGEAGEANFDHIVSFGGRDSVELSKSFFSALTMDDHGIAKGTFVLGTSAQDGDDHLIYDKGTGKLFYDEDGKGGVDQVLIAIFDDKHTLGRDDFHLG